LILWIRFANWIACRKYLMKDLSAISYGLIQMIGAVGVSLPEELGTPSARIFLSNSTTRTDSNLFLELINW